MNFTQTNIDSNVYNNKKNKMKEYNLAGDINNASYMLRLTELDQPCPLKVKKLWLYIEVGQPTEIMFVTDDDKHYEGELSQ